MGDQPKQTPAGGHGELPAGGTDVGDYVRIVLVLAAQDDGRTLAATEKLTDRYWKGTARGVPTRARALHLLGQMLTKIGIEFARAPDAR
ncbi:hypothetical protein ABT026_17565 [Streptomyces sp. NPDC002734]|uniref:hypothetical protein n=1 Tax=Streptomyces sp. NPDC002734 TaxID=3154426 RepID=UPI00333438DC